MAGTSDLLSDNQTMPISGFRLCLSAYKRDRYTGMVLIEYLSRGTC